MSSSCETTPADGGLACAANAHTTSGLFLSKGAFFVPAKRFASMAAFRFAPKSVFTDSTTPRSTSSVAPFLGQGCGRVAGAHVRKMFVAAVAVLALAASVAFAPGLALAASDPGSGSAEHITTQSQTQHSTDPATTKTGSFKSSASSSSAQSTKSSAKSSSAASSSANSTPRASSSASAAPQESTSGSGESFTTRIATEHRTASVTYSNAHAHKASMYALNQKQKTSSKASTVTYSASSRTLGSAFGSAAPASASVGAGVQAAPAGASADADLYAATDSAAESTAMLTVSSLNASAVGNADVASRLTASTAAGMIAGTSSAGNVYGTTSAARVENAPLDAQGQSPASDGTDTNSPSETPFDNPRSRSSAYATLVNMPDSSLETLSNKCASENLPFISGCAVVENEARQDETGAAVQEAPSAGSITASTSVLAPEGPDVENSDGSSIAPDEPSDSTVTDPGDNVENPGDGSGDATETPDKPTDPAVPETPDNPDNPDTPDTPDDPEPPAVTDDPVQITYKAGEGGSVSYGSDLISSSTGYKLDKNGQPTKEEVNGAAATPDIGYHFTGWTIETPDGTEPISVCDKAALDHWIVKDCAHSKLTGCYKPVSFIANFKRNEYVLDYDGNGGSLGDAVVSTQATFGNDDALKSAAAPQKEGHEFLCWNTNASGTGVSVHEGELLSEQLLRSMVRTSSIEDADGAGIKLYALWSTAEPVQEPDVPVAPVDPVTPVTPAPRPSQPVVEQPASSAANRTPVVGASQAVVADSASTSAAAPAEEASAADDASALLGFTERIGDIGSALSFAPIAGLLPTVEPFITMSAEALAGIGDGAVGVTPADATRAIGSVATAAGVIALAAGIAGAASTSLARRRALRSLSEPFTKE